MAYICDIKNDFYDAYISSKRAYNSKKYVEPFVVGDFSLDLDYIRSYYFDNNNLILSAKKDTSWDDLLPVEKVKQLLETKDINKVFIENERGKFSVVYIKFSALRKNDDNEGFNYIVLVGRTESSMFESIIRDEIDQKKSIIFE
jgi:hypothetical protein